jgi:hypothetical protein
MLDEMDRLRKNHHLLELLNYYARLGAEHREAWQGRLMQMENLDPSEISKLHGELIAFGWVDQNTGQVPICYRITQVGLRALRQAKAHENEDDDLQEAA